MSTEQVERRAPPKPSCRLQPHILLQMLISHYLATLAGVDKVKRLLPATGKDTQLSKKALTAVEQLLPMGDERLLDHPWNSPQGSLSRMHQYATLLTFAVAKSKPIRDFSDAVARAWRLGLATIADPTASTVAKLIRAVDALTKGFVLLLEPFRQDENVLYFLLRHQQQLDDAFGEGFLRRLFKKLHPEGVSGIESLLLRRYRQRGFAHLSKAMSEQLRALE